MNSPRFIKGENVKPGMVLRFVYGDWDNWVNAYIKSVEPREGCDNELLAYFDYGPGKVPVNNDVVLMKDGTYELVG